MFLFKYIYKSSSDDSLYSFIIKTNRSRSIKEGWSLRFSFCSFHILLLHVVFKQVLVGGKQNIILSITKLNILILKNYDNTSCYFRYYCNLSCYCSLYTYPASKQYITKIKLDSLMIIFIGFLSLAINSRMSKTETITKTSHTFWLC
jgi:hypothetical protein